MERKRESKGRAVPAFKIVVVGEGKRAINSARVGKTSIILRYVKNEFDEYQKETVPVMNVSYLEKKMQVNDMPLKLNIWVDQFSQKDTAGQEKYHALNKIYYRNANGNQRD